MTIAQNVAAVKERIQKALDRAGRTDSVKLVAVTKMVDFQETMQVVDCGVDAIAENRLNVAAEKLPHIYGVEKHFIGHLQSNKVKAVVEMVDVIESVDSVKLARKINSAATYLGKVVKVLLQINVSEEEQKYGFSVEEVEDAYKEIMGFVNVKVIGLMCMAPYVQSEETRPIFRKAKQLADSLGLKEISMGMTNDFEVAIEEGSTMVRVGRALFE